MKPLIVTTNVDLMLERALLKTGVSFVRVVQKKQGTISNRYDIEFGRPPSGGWWLAGKPSFRLDQDPSTDAECSQLQELICTYGTDEGAESRNPWAENDPRLVLYKYHGSADAPRNSNCVLSIKDYESRTKGPDEIMAAVKNRSGLFVGYTVLDPQLRHLRRSLLQDKLPPVSYAVHTALPNDCLDPGIPCLGRTVWNEMSDPWVEEYGARRLEDDAVTFLTAIERAL